MLLGRWVDGQALAGEDRGQPCRRPGALGGCVDMGQRLELDAVTGAFGQAPAEILPVAAAGDGGGADAAAEIEGEDLRAFVAAELQRHQRQQHRLAGAGRRSEEHTSELQSLMRTSYAVFCLKKK